MGQTTSLPPWSGHVGPLTAVTKDAIPPGEDATYAPMRDILNVIAPGLGCLEGASQLDSHPLQPLRDGTLIPAHLFALLQQYYHAGGHTLMDAIREDLRSIHTL